MDITGDLSAIFDTDVFAERAIYRAGGTGAGVEVAGIFDNGHAAQGLGALAGEGREITFRCREADVPRAQQADTLALRGTTYRVRSARPDGTGVIVLVLGFGG